jgi:hypothetical protein
MRAQLVGQRHAMVDQVLACPHRGAQRHCRFGVGGERAQPQPVAAQCVGQHERAEAVVPVAGLAVATSTTETA